MNKIDWQKLCKNLACLLWGLIVITIILYSIRYTFKGAAFLFSWSYPLSWALLLAVILTIAALILAYLRQK